MTTNGSTTSYAYDGWGRRVKKTTGSTVTGFLWDGDDLYADLDASQNPTAEYAFYPGIDQPHSVRKANFTYYYASELPGHVSGLFYGSTVSDSYRYTPWGLAEGTASSGWNRLRYMSREWDSESSLYYVRNRYYDPQLRRFISEDPIGLAGGINRYAFVGDDPINYRDPSGLQPPCPSCIPGIIVTVPRQYRLPPAGLWGAALFANMEGRANQGDQWAALQAYLSIAKDVAELKRDAVGMKPSPKPKWKACAMSAAGLTVSAIGDATFFSGVGLAWKGAKLYKAGRAGIAAVRSGEVVQGRGALLRLSKRQMAGGIGAMSIGGADAGYGWVGGIQDNVLALISAGDDRWWTIVPGVGTAVGVVDTGRDCGAAIRASF